MGTSRKEWLILVVSSCWLMKSIKPLFTKRYRYLLISNNIVFFFCFQSSFHALKTWIKELTRFGPPDILIAIAGNKCDKAEQREVSWLEL